MAIIRNIYCWLDIQKAAEQYIDRIKQNPQWGYNIRGILDDNIA